MREFEYTDHAGDTVRAAVVSSRVGCDCGPGTVRIDGNSVHLPIPQQRALAQWLIDHLAKVRPGEDVSLGLDVPETLEAPQERPSGYLLTLSVEGAELSVSDGVSLPGVEMQMLIDVAGRAMERFRLELDGPTPQAATDLDEFLCRLADALHVHSDDGFDDDELIADVEQLYVNNAHHADGYVYKSEMLDARHREMAKALGVGANATFEQLIEIAKRAVAQVELKQLRALMPPQAMSGQDGSAITYFTDLTAQWKRIRDALHAAGRPVPPSDTATAVENMLSAESELRAQRDIVTVALERVRAEFFGIDEEPFEGHVSAGASRAIVAKIDNALSAARG